MKKLACSSLQFITLLFVIVFITRLSLFPVYAADTLGIESKIDTLKQQIASRAAEIKGEVNKKVQNKVYAGAITDISGNQITLTTQKGDRVVRVNEYTQYTSTISSASSLENLSVNDFVEALGDIDDKDALVAKKVIKDKAPKRDLNPPKFATIQSASSEAILVKSTDSTTSDLTFTPNSLFKLTNKKATLVDLIIGKAIIYITQNGNPAAQFIYIITQ